MGAGAVLFAAANPAEGAAVTPGVIVSSQIIVIRQSQHGGAVVHVQGAHGVGQRLILILIGQGEAVRVVHLDDGRAATGHGRFGGKEHGDLRPALEDIDQQIVALHVAVKRGEEVTPPASGQVGDADQSQLAHQTVAPEVARMFLGWKLNSHFPSRIRHWNGPTMKARNFIPTRRPTRV